MPHAAASAGPAPPESDLSISVTTDRDFAIMGENLLYTAVVTNDGPTFAPSTDITVTLPTTLTVIESDGCAGDPAGVPTCELQTVNNGESKTATFLVRVDDGAQGSISAEFSVSSSRPDPVPGNNDQVLTTPLSGEDVIAAGSSPTIASDPTSSQTFAIAWAAPIVPPLDSGEAEASNGGIRAQLFNSAGMPVGVELRLDVSGSTHLRPDIARRGDAEMVAVWESEDSEGAGIYGRLFNAAGMPVGVEMRLNTSESREQSSPAVAGFGDGRFAAAWSDEESLGSFVRALRLFNSAGMPVGVELRFGASDIATKAPSIAVSNARILVTWENAGDQISGQLFSLAGMPVGVELQIAPDGVNAYPQVAKHSDGGFVVVWQNESGLDADANGIFGRRLDLAGMPVGVEFQVNELIDGDQERPAIAAAPDGTFAVTWQGPDADGTGVYARRLDLAGMPVGVELRMNLSGSGDQSSAEPAFVDGDGTFYVAWQSDEEDSEIILAPPSPLFADDFESGDFGAWSAHSP